MLLLVPVKTDLMEGKVRAGRQGGEDKFTQWTLDLGDGRILGLERGNDLLGSEKRLLI